MFVCDICGQKFKTQNDLDAHQFESTCDTKKNIMRLLNNIVEQADIGIEIAGGTNEIVIEQFEIIKQIVGNIEYNLKAL